MKTEGRTGRAVRCHACWQPKSVNSNGRGARSRREGHARLLVVGKVAVVLDAHSASLSGSQSKPVSDTNGAYHRRLIRDELRREMDTVANAYEPQESSWNIGNLAAHHDPRSRRSKPATRSWRRPSPARPRGGGTLVVNRHRSDRGSMSTAIVPPCSCSTARAGPPGRINGATPDLHTEAETRIGSLIR